MKFFRVTSLALEGFDEFYTCYFPSSIFEQHLIMTLQLLYFVCSKNRMAEKHFLCFRFSFLCVHTIALASRSICSREIENSIERICVYNIFIIRFGGKKKFSVAVRVRCNISCALGLVS